MKYYIVDDEIGTVKTLENILESRGLGEVIGYSTDPEQAVREIIAEHPEIVLVDLLMSKMDGIALVEKVKAVKPAVSFVMISQVADKGMVEEAYQAGVEFFIHKPINLIEVETVLKNVADRIKMNSIVRDIKGMFEEQAPRERDAVRPEDRLREINLFLGMLGMLGEKGTADILEVCRYLIEQNAKLDRDVLAKVAEAKGETSKNVEQRIRRAIKKGLNNVASLGVDDYGNEVFQVYANYVFDFKNIRDEMDHIKGKSAAGGRVSISKFVEGLLLYGNS